MKQIIAKNLSEAWTKACAHIYNYGMQCPVDKVVYKEALNLSLCIENSHELNHDFYFKYFNGGTYEGVTSIYMPHGKNYHGHNYGKRIYNYRGINQINKTATLLSKDPLSKSATIVLSDPTKDGKHIPCVMDINFKIREEKLLATFIFKSCDVAKKFIPDLVALSNIHAQLSRKLQIARGPIYAFIMSAQIHREDKKGVKKLVKDLGMSNQYFNQEKTINNWNKEAEQWETHLKNSDHYVNIEDGYNRFLNFTKKVLTNNHLPKSGRCLDLGCGTGAVANRQKKYSKNIIGVDIADKMIDEARKKVKGVKFVLANSLDLPFPDQYFKLIASRGILISHVGKKYYEDLIKEANRVLAKKGYFIFDFLANINKGENKLRKNKAIFNKTKITRLLEKNGFKVMDFDGQDNQRVNSVFCIKNN